MNRERRVIVIAGPNGAGKSTFAREFLPNEGDCPVFVNADLIAAGLSPFAPEKAAIRAGRLMLEELHRHAAAGESFAFETTLSGRGYAPLVRVWQEAGYRVHLVFLRLPTVDVAVERVAARVAQGGHDIPPQVIARRFIKGWRNFEQLYRGLVDTWQVFDNSGEVAVLLEEGERS
ncbi:AAA family ATPase [Rhodocyclus purpureus]|uniref:AAA family ATPase n=1 Tax=Rhodocyclus purpureus TaxID=1067 RepID=UPI001913CD55|nr:AAA family ATPase [Rhodocyclus purpureus]MBK5914128.1 Zeta toxin family protein [Rhodocyclus purpureus]